LAAERPGFDPVVEYPLKPLKIFTAFISSRSALKGDLAGKFACCALEQGTEVDISTFEWVEVAGLEDRMKSHFVVSG